MRKDVKTVPVPEMIKEYPASVPERMRGFLRKLFCIISERSCITARSDETDGALRMMILPDQVILLFLQEQEHVDNRRHHTAGYG